MKELTEVTVVRKALVRNYRYFRAVNTATVRKQKEQILNYLTLSDSEILDAYNQSVRAIQTDDFDELTELERAVSIALLYYSDNFSISSLS